MEYLNSFTNTNTYNSNKPSLNEKENYVVYLKDKKMIEVKSLSSYVIFETKYDSIIHILTNENERIAVELTKGVNKIDNVFYGYDIIGDDIYSTKGITSIDISHLIVDNLKTVKGLFNELGVETINLGKLSFDNLTDMSYMFSYCNSLKSLDLSSFDTSNVTNMNYMFGYCSGLTNLDLSNFNTSNVTNMSYMFNDCNSLESLDLSNFDLSNAIYINNIFYECNSLMYIKCTQSVKDWCIANQDRISLPQAMREDGSGTWDIVDSKP